MAMNQARHSKKRRAENEVIFRRHNRVVEKQVETILPEANKAVFPVSFMCECSNEDCQEYIDLPITEYHRIHTKSKRFIVLPGHIEIDLERVVEHFDGFHVCEKFAEPPKTNGILNKTDAGGPATA